MKIRVVGGPVKGNVTVDVKHSEKFSDIFKKIDKVVQHENLWKEFQLHPALLVNEEGARRVRPLPHVVQPEDTPKALELPQDGAAFVMLRPLGSAPPSQVPDKESAVTGESVSPGRNTLSESPAANSGDANPNPGASYHDRLVAIYTKYQPEKLHTINGTLKKFAGKEEAVIKQLVGKYGPEPRIAEALQEAAAANSVVAAQAAAQAATAGNGAAPSDVRELSPREGPGTASMLSTPEPTPREGSTAGVPTSGSNPNPSASYTDRVTAIYAKYEPEKVPLVAATLRKYAGREDAVIRSLVKKYGPEPVIGVDVQLPGAAQQSQGPPPPASPLPAAAGAPPNTEESQPTPPSSQLPATADQGALQPQKRSYRERLIAIYTKYQPDKLNTVEGNLRRFAGREESVIEKLVQRYGPEPVPEEAPSLKEAADQRKADSPTVTVTAAPEVPSPAKEAAAKSEEVSNKPAAVEVVMPTANVTAVAAISQPQERSPVIKTAVISEPERDPEPVQSQQEGGQADEHDPIEAPVASQAVSSPAVAVMDLGSEQGNTAVPVQSPTPVRHMEPIVEEQTVSRPDAPVFLRVRPPSEEPAKAETPTQTTQEPAAVTATGTSPPPPPPHTASSQEEQQKAEEPDRAAPLASERGTRRKVGRVEAKCAELLAKEGGRALQQRCFTSWLDFRDARKAQALLNSGLWEKLPGQGLACRLVDNVEPPYVVADLIAHVRQLRTPVSGKPRPFSDTVVLALRAVIESLKKCLRSQAIEITSEEESRMAEDFIRQWESEEDLCPVEDSAKLSTTLQQAAHFLSQIEDLVNVTRNQDGQLSKLKEMHEQLQTRSTESQAMEDELKSLVEQLRESKKRQKSLEAALEAATATTPRTQASTPRGAATTPRGRPTVLAPSRGAVVSPRGVSAAGAAGGEKSRQTPTEMRQEAQIVHLQQELAKARSIVSRSKLFEDKLKQQLEESEERQMRLRRVVAATAAATESTRHGSRSPRSGSANVGSSRHESPAKGLVSVHRACFSQPQVSPRRRGNDYGGNGSTPAQQTNPSPAAHAAAATSYSPEVRLPDATVLDRDERVSGRTGAEGSSPWPTSRYVPPVPEIDRGPCPTCLTPLTSISPDVMGPANERAAFCFSCRRSFTFGELAHRETAGPSYGLSDLWNSR